MQFRKKSIFLLIFSFWLVLFSCNMRTKNVMLPGKLVVSKLMSDEYFTYINSDTPKFSFKLPKSQGIEYGGLNWLHSRDAFIGTESISGLTKRESKCNIVEFDISGRLTQTIYEADRSELAWPEYSSWDDKYLIFTIHRTVDSEIYPFENLAPMLSLVIIDLEQKRIVTKVDSIGRYPNFSIKESPWLHNGYQFVYSIDNGFNLKSGDKSRNGVDSMDGIYLFDVLSGKSKLLIPGGCSATVSPMGNQIAYEKENSIRVMDLNASAERILYNYSSKVQLYGKHWTPDGQAIYFAYTRHWGIGNLFHSGERLIEVSTRKWKTFREIGHGFESYTWK